MMERLWADILERFGQDVVLRKNEGDISVRALVQPCLSREREQEVPGPLGLGKQGCFRYMGPPGQPLDLDTVVRWKGQEFRVRSANLVGDGICAHWWAMLCPRDEVL